MKRPVKCCPVVYACIVCGAPIRDGKCIECKPLDPPKPRKIVQARQWMLRQFSLPDLPRAYEE